MEILAEIILLTAFAICIGWCGRMNGGAPPKTPEAVERGLCLSPGVALGAMGGLPSFLLSFTGYGGIATGHGGYFLSRMIKAIEAETLDFLIRPFFGDDPRTLEKFAYLRKKDWSEYTIEEKKAIATEVSEYGEKKLFWRCFTGLCVTGLAFTLGLSIGLAISGFWFAALLASIAGAQKGLTYLASYKLAQAGWTEKFHPDLREDTALSEFLNMAACTVILYLAYKAMGL